MRWEIVKAATLVALIESTAAAPSADKKAELNIVKTTKENGITIDWVTRESQGKVFTPPLEPHAGADKEKFGRNVTLGLGAQGPDGTVPIVRVENNVPMKQPAPLYRDDNFNATELHARAVSVRGKHWYAHSSSYDWNLGGGAYISTHRPFVKQDGDQSLLQIAAMYVEFDHSNNTVKWQQTVEAGWRYYPAADKGGPVLFTYYTTDGYETGVDENYERGWFQYDKEISPGMPIAAFSVQGGRQEEIELRYRLHNGCWWLYTMGRYIGCYPASLFALEGVNPRNTLATRSSNFSFHGEVYSIDGLPTATEMGSGRPARDGWKYAAYMRDMKWIDINGQEHDWDGYSWADDDAGYSIETEFLSGTAGWNSYMFLGGRGTGRGRVY
ncbi:putative Glucoamylase [Metarhizium album ARSEF 1941]|uniref:Putative Glucoamylase n=1 Tax=Metarhizium album (strain ARSEF 1941) TaxID=1081103 RepID=A0A0B2WSM7_METAS|nr:putative Glucoamylase [Metarhizium album ARSEF 1941]KHN95955.1 putative Glucoamylase [Metarhizium album ARSEF 1941]